MSLRSMPMLPTPPAMRPTSAFSKRPVDRTTVLDIHMVSGGGNAIWIHPANEAK